MMTSVPPPAERADDPSGAVADENRRIAAMFDEVAELLEAEHADAHRVHAYQRGAQTLRALRRPVRDIFAAGGRRSLVALRHIGRGLAAAIEEVLSTGRLRLLERLRESVSPIELFASLPGLGPTLAARIVSRLELTTLEDLEAAAHDGRLESVQGVGPERAAAVRAVLAERLRRHPRPEPDRDPPVSLLLEVDRTYRRSVNAPAEQHLVTRVAPKRFNPHHVAWLPILHVSRGGWSLSAMFSNTAAAHRLNKTHDWVILAYERGGAHGQCTVVTEHRGPDTGRRVVRGREDECHALFASEPRPRFPMPACLSGAPPPSSKRAS